MASSPIEWKYRDGQFSTTYNGREIVVPLTDEICSMTVDELTEYLELQLGE